MRRKDKITVFYGIIILAVILSLYLYYRKNYSEGFEGEINLNVLTHADNSIPKIIWTFWDTEELPDLINNIKKNNIKKLLDWNYIFVTNNNIHTYIPKNIFPKNYESLQASFKSDWIRLFLLKTYGGCWIDASIIINDQETLNVLYNQSVQKRSQLTCFILDPTKIYKKLNIPLSIESWFIIAPKNGSVINTWFNEFNKAVEIGFLNYKKNIIKEGIDISGIGLGYPTDENEVYLTVFACLNKVLQKSINPLPPLIFKNANDTMMKLHSQCKFDNKCVMNKFNNEKENVKNIPYIKLVGADRHTGIDISEYFK